MGSCQLSETCAEHENSLATKQLQRAQWLRAAILGANDGLLSTTLLILGVGAAKQDKRSVVLSGIAGALAGAFSMTVGEFVSVSTQRDIEKASLTKHCNLADQNCPEGPEIKVTNDTTVISVTGKTEPKIAEFVGKVTPKSELLQKLSPSVIIKIPTSSHDVYSDTKPSSSGTNLEPKLTSGMSPTIRSPLTKVIENERHQYDVLPSPYKAAAASGLAFLCGSIVPILPAIFIAQNTARIVAIGIVASVALALFGAFGAYLGGSRLRISAARVLVGGWIAMVVTYGLLRLFDNDNDDKRRIIK